MTTCSQDSRQVGEPLAGTAPLASSWIVVEQPGPWGRKAVTESRLPEALAAHLSAADGTGVKVILARHPDRPERTVGPERHVWVARSAPGGALLRHGVVADLRELMSWDLRAIAEGALPALGRVERSPVHFVCTNGTRDQCCATAGRPLLATLLESRAEAAERDRLWECSHIGGHRFAPVMLSLPTAAVHGRLGPAEAELVIERSSRGQILLDSYRGRTALPPPFQVAAIEVRTDYGIEDVEDLDVLRVVGDKAVPLSPGVELSGDADSIVGEVRHRDGRTWRALLRRIDLPAARRESCTGELVAGHRWTCAELSPGRPWSG